MNLKRIKNGNSQELTLTNGDVVLISYSTPVAANVDGKFYRTAKHYSPTTSKHITQWLHGAKSEPKEQGFFDALV